MSRLLHFPAVQPSELTLSAATVSYSIAATPWAQPAITLPKFDEATLGKLWTVEFEFSYTFRSTARVENTSPEAAPGTVSGARLDFVATTPGGVFTNNTLEVSFTNNLGAYDGLADYGGSSGVSNARRTETLTETQQAPDVSPFIGTGDFTMSVTAAATGFCVGPALFLLAVIPELGLSVTVRYRYQPKESISGITGTFFDDPDDDGVRQPEDEAIAGVEVQLLDTFGSPVGTATTADANGFYFVPVPDTGYYTLQFTPPGGSPTTYSEIIEIYLNQLLEIDIGVHIEPTGVRGGAWHDLDANGTPEFTDVMLPGVAVELLDSEGNPTGVSTVTDETGFYFLPMVSGNYFVRYTPPAGMAANYDVDGADGSNQFAVTAVPGATLQDYNIGFVTI